MLLYLFACSDAFAQTTFPIPVTTQPDPAQTVQSVQNILINYINALYQQTQQVVGGITIAICGINTANQNACASVMQHYDIRWFGAQCNGSGDDGGAIQSAANVACTSQIYTVFVPHATCNVQREISDPCNGFTLASEPQHMFLDPTTIDGGQLYFNTGDPFFTTTHQIDIDMNGHNINLQNINISGDGAQSGYGGIADSVTYPGSGPLPEINADNVSISRQGTGIGCAMNDVYVTPGSNTSGNCIGSLEGNLISVRGHHLILTQNGWGLRVNSSDLFLDVLSQVAGNNCGGIYMSTGSADGHILARFDENGGGINSGNASMCGSANWADLTITSYGTNIDSQFELGNGPGVLLTGAWRDVHIGGHFLDNGKGGTSGKDANIVIDGTTGAGVNTGADIDAVFLSLGSPPKYDVELLGTADTNISIRGSAPSSSYATSFLNAANESLPANSLVLTLGQTPVLPGGVICSGSPTGSFAVTNGVVTHC